MARNRTQVLVPALCVLASAMPAAAAPADVARATDGGIDFGRDFEAALARARDAGRVTVVYFYGPNCTWCRKMQITTFADRRVLSASRRFVWVKVDVSRSAQTAGLFNVVSVPTIVMLNTRGEVLAANGGYMTAEALTDLLRKHVDNADAPGINADRATAIKQVASDLAAAKTSADRLAAVGAAVERLSARERTGRKIVLAAIKKLGRGAWGGLIQRLADQRLAVRAVAGELARITTGSDLAFDPFAPAKIRNKQVAAWRDWMTRNKDQPEKTPASRNAATAPAPAVPADKATTRGSQSKP